MAFGHGLGKLTGFSQRAQEFADPLGVGGPASLALVVFAEFFCSIAVTLGFLTRLAAVPTLIAMLMAGLVIHGVNSWPKPELALLYAAVYLSLVFSGAGRFSLDHLIFRSLRR